MFAEAATCFEEKAIDGVAAERWGLERVVILFLMQLLENRIHKGAIGASSSAHFSGKFCCPGIAAFGKIRVPDSILS